MISFHFEKASGNLDSGSIIVPIEYPPRKPKENSLTPSAISVNFSFISSGNVILLHSLREAGSSPSGCIISFNTQPPTKTNENAPIPQQ